MPITDDINIAPFINNSNALERWAASAGMDRAAAHDIWVSAQHVVNEMQHSGVEPAAAMHTVQIIFMMIVGACKISQEEATEFWNAHTAVSLDAAREYTESWGAIDPHEDPGVVNARNNILYKH